MADESLEVLLPFEFSASAKPHSMTGYDLDALSQQQQEKLNALKLETKREDEIYLAAHPEVRAIVALLTRSIFCSRPHSIHEHAAKFFRRSNLDADVSRYLEANPPEPEYVPPSPEETGPQVGPDVDKSLLEDAVEAMDAETMTIPSHISDYKDKGGVKTSPSTESVSTVRFIENLISSTFMTPDIGAHDRPSSQVDDSKIEDASKDMEKTYVDYESVQDVTNRIAYDDDGDKNETLFKTQGQDDDEYYDDDDEYYVEDYDDIPDDEDGDDGGDDDEHDVDDDEDDDDDDDYDRPRVDQEKKDVVERVQPGRRVERISDMESPEEDSDDDVPDWTAPVAPSARKRRATKEF